MAFSRRISSLVVSILLVFLIKTALFSSKNSYKQYSLKYIGTLIGFIVDRNTDNRQGYDYEEDVDIRIIVMAYHRADYLQKTLGSISKLKLDEGETAAVEIWIDITKEGDIDNKTLKVANLFEWSQGISRVHMHTNHRGLYSHWLDTWRPKEDSSEIVLFVEDDIDISPFAYKYLRAIFDYYRYEENIAIVCLQDEIVPLYSGPERRQQIEVPDTEPFYLFRIPGTWGCAPHPHHWTKFRDWYYSMKHNTQFHPNVSEVIRHYEWYRNLEKQNRQGSMWIMWYIYYMKQHDLFGLNSNLPTYLASAEASLSVNRRGVVFRRNMTNIPKLLSYWTEDLFVFPKRLKKFGYEGKEIID